MKSTGPDPATSDISWISSSMPYLRPQEPGEPDAWTKETAGRGTQKLVEVGPVAPPVAIRQALDLGEDETVIVRRRVISLDGTPIELADSYYPTRVASGTALAVKAKIPGGAPTLLAKLGFIAARVTEDVEARGASDDEALALRIEQGQPVFSLLRTSASGDGAPFEAATMVTRGPHRMRYEMRVD
jgi:DNA-binding GntR family transcriptional regulator